MKFLARLIGGLASVLFDMRRVRCDFHVPSDMTWPTACARCGSVIK